jgi:beta-lactamase regulating signal transducer with metallopeptidase domain
MYQYFSINIIVSALTLFYISQFKAAPSRISFRFVFIALLSWLIPYDVINAYFASNDYTPLLPALDEFRNSVKTSLVSQMSEKTQLTLQQILLFLSGIGFMVFIKDFVLFKQYTKNLNAKFYKKYGPTKVYFSENLDNAFCYGIVKPKVFVNATMINSPEFESILQHELQHIKQHDNIYIAVISFIQRILWWNPLQLLLTQKARAFLELSCDEKTAQSIGKKHYQKDLATLLLNKNDTSNSSLMLSFFGKKKLTYYE